MNVLITGGAGHIGSHVTERLLARGDQILVIDNYQTGRRDNLALHKNLQIVEGTIADRDTVRQAFESFKPDVVVHAAASYKDPENWTEDVLTNILGAVNVCKAAKATGVQRLVYFQTALCYGLNPLEQPITIDHPLFGGTSQGGSSYAISKTGAEQYIEMSGLDFISFRLANSYGPRNLSGPLPTFYSRLTNGKPCFVMNTRRDFIFVEDLVDIVIKAVDGMGSRGYYHVSSGSDYSIKELYDLTVEALGMKPAQEVEIRERNPDDAYTILLDPEKTAQDFGWKVKTPLRAGIQKAIMWYQTHGLQETYTHLKTQK